MKQIPDSGDERALGRVGEGQIRVFEQRPHGAIGNKVPISLVKSDGAAGPPS